jgi:hypothetical protein
MKQSIKKILFFVAIILISIASGAQQRFYLNLDYNVSMPVGSTFRNYVSNTSFNGFQASILYNINNNFKIGVQGSWNDFYQKYGRQVYKNSDGADVSAVLSNTLQSVPVVVKGEYSFIKNGLIKPFVGLGAGINIISFEQYIGEFVNQQTFTKAAFSGDVGVMIPFGKTSQYGARVSTSYNMSPFKEQGIDNINTWNVQGGVVIPLR